MNDIIAWFDSTEHIEEAVTNNAWQFSVFEEGHIVYKVGRVIFCPWRDASLCDVHEQRLEVALSHLFLEERVDLLVEIFD